jgi:hypothetical protein
MHIHISTFPIISLDSPGRFLSAASNKQILARMLLNPKRIYQQ